MYKCVKLTNNSEFILKNDELWIPKDENNSDYQEYLVWISEGNIPEIVEGV